MILLENLEVVKNRENDTYDEVNVYKSAHDADDPADEGELCTDTDKYTCNSTDNELNKDVNDKCAYAILCFEGIGEDFLESFHF